MINKCIAFFLTVILQFVPVWCLKGVSLASDKEFYCMPTIKAAIFSPDSNKIIFQHGCVLKEDTFSWAVYEISSKKIYDYEELNNATPHQLKYDPALSRDGKQIAFVSGQDNHRNIYVMNADGTNVHQLTHDYNDQPVGVVEDPVPMKYNEKPSFSPDGKRIIFVRSAVKRRFPLSSPARYPSCWDVYEIEINTGKERKLTNYGFLYLSPPYYLADGKRFIFSADLWASSRAKAESFITRKVSDAYEDKYNLNYIFIMDGINNELRPAFENGRQSDEPRVGGDDIMIFQSKLNYRDRTLWSGRTPDAGFTPLYATFVYKFGKIHRLVDKPTRYATLSQDGSRILYAIQGFSIEIINVDGTGQAMISIPWEQMKSLNKYYTR